MTAREKAIRAHRTLLSDSDKLYYFEERGISPETVRAAWVGYDAARGAFIYPCLAKCRGLLGIHYKSEERDQNGKRRQWWGGYAEDLPPKGRGKAPGDPAKVIPFGLETLGHLEPGSRRLVLRRGRCPECPSGGIHSIIPTRGGVARAGLRKSVRRP